MVHLEGRKHALHGMLKMGAAYFSGTFLTGTGSRYDIICSKHSKQTHWFESRRKRVGFYSSDSGKRANS